MQSDDPNVLNATGDNRPDETTDSGIATLQLESGTGVRADRHNEGPGNCWCKCCHTLPRAASSTRPPEWCQTIVGRRCCREHSREPIFLARSRLTGRPDGHRSTIKERGIRAEARTASSGSSADAGHVDPAGSTQAGRFYDHESP